MGEVGKGDALPDDLEFQLFEFLVRSLEKCFKHAELFHELQSRRVNRITTKVAQKISVLFNNDNVNASAR